MYHLYPTLALLIYRDHIRDVDLCEMLRKENRTGPRTLGKQLYPRVFICNRKIGNLIWRTFCEVTDEQAHQHESPSGSLRISSSVSQINRVSPADMWLRFVSFELFRNSCTFPSVKGPLFPPRVFVFESGDLGVVIVQVRMPNIWTALPKDGIPRSHLKPVKTALASQNQPEPAKVTCANLCCTA